VRVRIVAFASTAEILGSSESEIELAPGASMRDLRAALTERWPELTRRLATVALAVNGELATEATALAEGAEVALLPPVSGG